MEKDKKIIANVSLVLFVFAFFSLTILPYFIHEDSNIIFMCLALCAILTSSIRFSLKVGLIPVLLFSRIILFFINSMAKGISFVLFVGQERVTFCAILAFLYAYNFISKDKKEIKIIIALTSIMTSMQIVFTALMSGGDKNYIGCAMGMSNYGAMFLFINIIYYCFTKKTAVEIVLFALNVAAFLITQSFGGYIALFVLLIYLAVTKVNWKSKITYIVILALVICLPLIALFSLKTGIGASFVNKILDKFTYLFSGDLNAFGSSRLELYEFSIKNIMKDPVFGNILNIDFDLPADYRFQGFRTHNFVLESLLLYGIVGTVLNGFLLYYIFKKAGRNPLKNPVKKICFFIIVLGLVHGFVEPNLFTFNYNVYFWVAVGLFIRKEEEFGQTICFADCVASRI